VNGCFSPESGNRILAPIRVEASQIALPDPARLNFQMSLNPRPPTILFLQILTTIEARYEVSRLTREAQQEPVIAA